MKFFLEVAAKIPGMEMVAELQLEEQAMWRCQRRNRDWAIRVHEKCPEDFRNESLRGMDEAG
jgi:hypothetical protein